MDPDAALEAEALRIYRRYMVEFVEAYGMCPWAERARKEGNVDERVVLSADAVTGPALEAVSALSRDEEVHVGLVIFPRLALERADFERFVARLREEDAERWENKSPPMAMAAFHPDSPVDLENPSRAVLFVRRSPDPTIQLVRRSILDAVRRPEDQGTGYVDPSNVDFASFMAKPSKPLLHELVAETNLETIHREGVERILALFEDIRRDRDASYAAIEASG